jgi:hypothetical protein
MDTINIHQTSKSVSGKILWAGRIISWLCVLFLLVDAIMKLILHPIYVEGTTQLGWSSTSVQPLGFLLLCCTALYVIPRTAILGAVVLTGYFGGAIATMARLGQPFVFPAIFALLLWISLYIRNEKLKEIVALLRN